MAEPITIPRADRRDIDELKARIQAFRNGREDEERFKHYRLTRGVYGQRQSGVQMFRTKIPAGRLTPDQLTAVANISERYTNGRLHLTTRQNIQMHYVRLDDSPAIWEELVAAGLTAREACGNTVRNVTASSRAGIDPAEPFDVLPYALATFEYFLRNPICQEMGRKIKPAFSTSEMDAAFAYFHDFGFIPRVRHENGREVRGFKVLLAGGLGAQSIVAQTVDEFMPEERIIPFMEACLRVFDRYGEREKRMKARMKFLVKSLGLEPFLALVEAEQKALPHQVYWVDRSLAPATAAPRPRSFPALEPPDPAAYELWTKTNVLAQKQAGYYAVQVRVPLGNLEAETARRFAALAKEYAAEDLRITVNQGLLLRFVQPDALPHLYQGLQDLGLAGAGFDTLADITACPGTDTCALGVSNSTGLARQLEEVIWEDFRHLVTDDHLKIKISGCMNACGQHMAAAIGFHGSSIKHGHQVLPAMQVVLGGGITPEGEGFIAEKITKLPTRRIPEALGILLNDYEENGNDRYYQHYVQEKGRKYFFQLIKHLSDLDEVEEMDFIDWGQDHRYIRMIGVGECAGAALDMVATILQDGQVKLGAAEELLAEEDWAGAIFLAYQAQVVGAKALLLARDVACNTHHGILQSFQREYVDTGEFKPDGEADFPTAVLSFRAFAPSADVASAYLGQGKHAFEQFISLREAQLADRGGRDQAVIADHYKA